MGALLDGMRLEADGRLAVLQVDNALMAHTGASVDDLDGLINLPLQVHSIEAVLMFKQTADGAWRASARSKGAIDVRAVAVVYGGGGHRNAAGFDPPPGDLAAGRAAAVAAMTRAIDAGTAASGVATADH
jgi:phosphoesterase RecJ-like protein